ncbi:type 1 glutamine amidotransferase family protein [Thiocapsa bogorovii]|uniref:hypothetical protein n=1 Tax=Thiocapsa bogorovii TaxID=521689 RepID=UPI001E5C0A34|nr:hypothetical protein [Thiocapsa bogorovii]UHD16437.1 hypothetical protein LT988_24905 [Thiocapsa bogorovii]
MKILIILTSHENLGDTGKKTGFWLEEFAAPYYVLLDAGAHITLASPAGGKPPLDPQSDVPDAQTAATERFKKDDGAQNALANTTKLGEIDADGFDAIFFPGGHGPLWDLLITNETPQAHVLSHRRSHTGAVTTTGSLHHGQEPHPVSEGSEFA